MTLRELVLKEKWIFDNAHVNMYNNGLLCVMDFVALIREYVIAENNFYIFFNPNAEQQLRCCFFNDQSVYLSKRLTLIPEPNMDKLEVCDVPYEGGKLDFIISLDEKCEKPIAALYSV